MAKRKTPDINPELLAAMREPSNKWDFIHRILEQEKASINANILSKHDDEGHELTAKQIYDLVTWHGFLDYVAQLPEMIIEGSKPARKQPEPNFETYDTPLSTVRKSIETNTDGT